MLESAGNSYGQNELLAYTEGVQWDKQLFRQEIKVQMAWLSVLVENQIISAKERSKAEASLLQIAESMADGSFKWKRSDEDIHMNIERELGDLGKRLHTGRSRNDLIATTLRLHVADQVDNLNQSLNLTGNALVKLAQNNFDVLIPGMTHMQHGQPVALAHVLLAHAWPILRVKQQLKTAKQLALANMPLGSGALAGSHLQGDFASMAEQLGFDGPSLNSYDAISDRDFMMAYLQAVSLDAVHLGRLCHDVIYWASTPVGLVQLHSEWSTGSSMMPQKRNPDVAEITRAKTARIAQNSATAQTIMHGLGTAYYSDMHELKKVYLDTVQLDDEIYSVWPQFVSSLSFQKERAAQLMNQGHLLATDLAQELVDGGETFRDAYRQVARLVQIAQTKGEQIHELEGVNLDMAKSVASRQAPGGSSRSQVDQQIANLLNHFQKD